MPFDLGTVESQAVSIYVVAAIAFIVALAMIFFLK